MGTKVLRALTSTLLIAGLFCASLPPPLSVYADEPLPEDSPEISNPETAPEVLEVEQEPSATATSTPAEVVEEQVATSTEVFTPTEEAPTLPTGVLYETPYADEEWSINIREGGLGAYFPGGYTTIGNPPTVDSAGFWTSTGTTTVARIKRISGMSCAELANNGTYGLELFTPDFTQNFGASYVRTDGEYCDFVFNDGIAPGTTFGMARIGVYGDAVLAGSHSNSGTSLTTNYMNPVDGGFAFQLCGTDGCSGGFSTTTPAMTTPDTATTTPEVGTTTPQVSNVLFLPGIKGSRLYKDEEVCGEDPGPCTMTLWEPYGAGLAYKLLLNPEGKSIHDVYAKEGDIMDEVSGQKFYATFMDEMNAKMASDEFGPDWEWRPIAYDWRLSLPDIVTNGKQVGDRIYYDQATSTPYIEQNLRELAASSATGKVTIIAHSNGGLVTKALLQKLGDAETAVLVDKIIFVGVPQSGAPQSLGALLFGYKESLPGKAYLPDALITKELSRELAENSPMAYHLMPSATYLADTQDPNHSIIGFSGSHAYQTEQIAYGTSIDTTAELYDFLLAKESGREKPDADDLTVANILNPDLISYAESTHASIDAWTPPSSVELYQVAGWGVDTISGIDFYDEQKLFGTTIGYKRQYRPIFVEDGDGVVPIPSSLMIAAAPNIHNFWVNLKEASSAFSEYNHGNIFEFSALSLSIRELIRNGTSTSEVLLTYQPENVSPRKKLIFQLHSPLTLGIYDTDGNYTGLNEDGSVSEDIPGTTYGEFGEVKYLIAPAGSEYELVLNGQDDGSFSLDIQEQIGDVSTTTTIADVSATSNTVARLTITSGIADASSLTVDTDGDGETDIEIAPVAGETTQYVTPVPVVEGVSADSSGSGSSGYIAVAPVSSPLAVITPPATISEALKALNPRVLGASLEEVEVPKLETSATATEARNLDQTASVYNAVSFFAEWLKSVLYNIWKAFLNLFDFL